jgi:cold shock CspA family protein
MEKMTRIGVFYDGNYFAYVSNYYCYHHEQERRLSIKGLHDFIQEKVASFEKRNAALCRIVDAHYFRGRLSAVDARQRNALYNERVFDHVLMNEGVVTHYLPLGSHGEKSIDIWYALEVYEQAVAGKFDVVVLVASDGNFVALARKLNALGVRVMVLGWDFSVESNGVTKETVTSQRLLSEVSYPLLMSDLVNQGLVDNDPAIEALFVSVREDRRKDLMPEDDIPHGVSAPSDYNPQDDEHFGEEMQGSIKAIKNGFGFITPEDQSEDLYFYWADLENCDFAELQEGDEVVFEKSGNQRGPCAKRIELLAEEDYEENAAGYEEEAPQNPA